MNHQFVPLLALLVWATIWISVDSSSITYCSTDSTGSGAANFSTYQSNGNCVDHCGGSAFGILQGKNCWCSDIAPNEASNVDTSKCDHDCPGFPDDWCGSVADGLYAYVQIGSPSGTASASSTSSTDSSSTTDDSTSTQSTTLETHGGQVTTVTVGDSGATSGADSSNTKEEGGGSGISGGSIAGIVVGVVGGIALVVAAIIIFLAKRRQRNQDPSYQNNSIDGRQSKGSQMSYVRGVWGDNHSHTLSNASTTAPQRMHTFTDNRLNTGAVLYPNGRRASDVSLQDNEDYSRPVLRLTNPD